MELELRHVLFCLVIKLKGVDGSKYTGSWENNKANGQGHFLYANGDEYEGHWESDQVSGLGVY
jgi:hypothetical protein